MRKSNIKSVMHWSIMGLIFGAPIVATLGSLIPKDYENVPTTEVRTVKAKSIEIGKRYRFNFPSDYLTFNISHSLNIYYGNANAVLFDYSGSAVSKDTLVLYNHEIYLYYNGANIYNPHGYIDFDYCGANKTFDENMILPYMYEVVNYVDYDLGMRTYNAMIDFKNLSINNWYNTMLNLTVGQPTGYDVISVLKMYPLYAIWVVVLDLMYDCMCFLPTMCHHWLHKIEGEDE